MTIQDPFATLGLPRRYGIDMREAEEKHLSLSRALHPDRYASAPAGERRMALQRAIEVNEAWRVARDPIKRAEAILQLEGLGDSIGETREPKPSQEFLMEALEERERLDEARERADAASVHVIVEEARARVRAVVALLEKAIDAESGGDRGDLLRVAVPLLGRLRYARRLLDDAISIEDRLLGD